MATYVEHAQLLVADLAVTELFYLSIFPDWQIRARGRETGLRPYSWIHIGTRDSYLAFRLAYEGSTEAPAGAERQSNHIGIVVEDAGGVIERLRHNAADFTVNDHTYRVRIYTRDPDGYELEVVQYKTDDPALRHDYSESVRLGTTVLT
jgi:hypothetical protein